MDDNQHISAHKHSAGHRKEILASSLCGCYYCGHTFPPSEIAVWIDDAQTALCLFCPVDSVIGNASGYPITKEFLDRMLAHWFRVRE